MSGREDQMQDLMLRMEKLRRESGAEGLSREGATDLLGDGCFLRPTTAERSAQARKRMDEMWARIDFAGASEAPDRSEHEMEALRRLVASGREE